MTRRQEKRLRRDLEVKRGDLVRQLRLLPWARCVPCQEENEQRAHYQPFSVAS